MKKNKMLLNVFEFILYLDCPNHLDCLNLLLGSDVRYIGICHDKDVYTDADLSKALYDGREVDWKVGDLKKSHYHLLVYFNKETSIDEIVSIYPVEKKDIQFAYDEKAALTYLTHRNRPDKFQYSIVEVIYNNKELFDKMKKYVNQEELKDENFGSAKILKYINDYKGYLTIFALTNYVLNNNLWSCYRRGFAVFNKLVIEHNQFL